MHLCSGVIAAEAVNILLGRPVPYPAPWYFQLDAYRQLLRKGRLCWGKRHPWQRLKRRLLRRRIVGLRTQSMPALAAAI